MDKKHQKTIIGSGFIAKNFKKYEEFFKKLDICVYATGVSNSLCKDKELLDKDKSRLSDFSKKIFENQILLYFSTCSIYDPSRNKNIYVRHKLDIENFIKENFKKYLIVRLPEVVGKNSNTNTLVNFFFNKITKKEKFDLWTNATRSIIDIEDVVKILIDFLSKKSEHKNEIINIANPEKISATHIVNVFENFIKIKANCNLVAKGEENWNIDTSVTNDCIKKCKIRFDNNYLQNVLIKYFT